MRPRIRIKPYALRLFFAVIVLFSINKLMVRPVLADLPRVAQLVSLSIPNFFEAIVGMFNVTGLLLLAKIRLAPRFDQIPDLAVRLLAAALTATYVLTQEFELHHLGGRNVYDPNDALASVVGVVVMFFVFGRFGLLERPVERLDEQAADAPRNDGR